MKRQKTSIVIDKVLWKQFKVYAAEEEKNLSVLIEELVRIKLAVIYAQQRFQKFRDEYTRNVGDKLHDEFERRRRKKRAH